MTREGNACLTSILIPLFARKGPAGFFLLFTPVVVAIFFSLTFLLVFFKLRVLLVLFIHGYFEKSCRDIKRGVIFCQKGFNDLYISFQAAFVNRVLDLFKKSCCLYFLYVGQCWDGFAGNFCRSIGFDVPQFINLPPYNKCKCKSFFCRPWRSSRHDGHNTLRPGEYHN